MVKILDKKFGKIIDVDKRSAAILVKLGKHSLVEEVAEAPEPVFSSTTIKVDDAKSFRQSKRQIENDLANMLAKTPEPAPVSAMTTEAAPELVTKPKRVYKRRDMKAESDDN